MKNAAPLPRKRFKNQVRSNGDQKELRKLLFLTKATPTAIRRAHPRPFSASAAETNKVSTNEGFCCELELALLDGSQLKERTKARALTLMALYASSFLTPSTSASAPSLVDLRRLSSYTLSKASLNYAEQLYLKITKTLPQLRELIIPYLKTWRFERLPCIRKNLLFLGFYLLQHEKQLPPKVLLNELILLARWYGEEKDYAFINAVLDNFLKHCR